MSEIRVKIITVKDIVDGKIDDVDRYIVTDDTDQPLDGKWYKDKEAADAVLESIGKLEEGLEYAKAQFPQLSEKAQRSKANTVASYLQWVTSGKPVKQVNTPKEEGEESF
jgi:hypothetical protein